MTTEDAKAGLNLVMAYAGRWALGVIASALVSIGLYAVHQNNDITGLLSSHTQNFVSMQREIDEIKGDIANHNKQIDDTQRQIKSDLSEAQKESQTQLERRQDEIMSAVHDVTRAVIAAHSDLMSLRAGLLNAKPGIVIPFEDSSRAEK